MDLRNLEPLEPREFWTVMDSFLDAFNHMAKKFAPPGSHRDDDGGGLMVSVFRDLGMDKDANLLERLGPAKYEKHLRTKQLLHETKQLLREYESCLRAAAERNALPAPFHLEGDEIIIFHNPVTGAERRVLIQNKDLWQEWAYILGQFEIFCRGLPTASAGASSASRQEDMPSPSGLLAGAEQPASKPGTESPPKNSNALASPGEPVTAVRTALAKKLGVRTWGEIELKVLARGIEYRRAGTSDNFLPFSWAALGVPPQRKVYQLLVYIATYGGTFPNDTHENRHAVVFRLNKAFCNAFGITDRPFKNSKALGTQSHFAAITFEGRGKDPAKYSERMPKTDNDQTAEFLRDKFSRDKF